MNKEITNILAPVAGVGAVAAGAGFVLGTLIGWLFLSDAMRPWQFGMIFALVTLLLVLLGAAPTFGAGTAGKASSALFDARPLRTMPESPTRRRTTA
ncbi:hypothetical protein ACHMZP_30545 [Rhodococcus baikonurensis]|uniref:hypothetical protein n=1 Tax=Rhodococcus baikonurensis TaxID=172041 RepID=UPI0037B515CB